MPCHHLVEKKCMVVNPPISVYQQLERYLEIVTDEAQLEKLFAVAVRGENLADFQAAVREE
jgi:hypothetical protein